MVYIDDNGVPWNSHDAKDQFGITQRVFDERIDVQVLRDEIVDYLLQGQAAERVRYIEMLRAQERERRR